MAQTRPADPSITQLERGKAAGTFHFICAAQATLAGDGKCELIATIFDAWNDTAATIPVTDPHEFAIEADLRPGTYRILLEPSKASTAEYLPSQSSLRAHIDKSGQLYMHTLGSEFRGKATFKILKRINGFLPDQVTIADGVRPTLTWTAVNGASFYEGSAVVGSWPQRIFTKQPIFTMSRDVPAGERCFWRLEALDKHGEPFAEGYGFFFGKGTNAAIVEKARSGRRSKTVQPAPSRAYLGVSLNPTWVNKIPSKPMPTGQFAIMPGSDTDFMPGIEVVDVCPDSPAIDAGLLPDDVIVAINDHPVQIDPKMGFADIQNFTEQLSAFAPGNQANLKVRRFPKELTITATLRSFSGAKRAAPATAPAGG